MKLSNSAKEILKQLADEESMQVQSLVDRGFDQAMVHRAALELEEKGLAAYEEDETIQYVLTDEGRRILEEGSPEYRLASLASENPITIQSAQEQLDSFNAAVGRARENGWITLEDGKVVADDVPTSDPVKQELEERKNPEKYADRGLLEARREKNRTIRKTEEASTLDVQSIDTEFNVEARTKTPRVGKKHFYKEIRNYARKVWQELGFREMTGDYVVPSFETFDSLYIPQNHPARDLQDTFFMQNPKTADLDEFGSKIERIRQVHESGGDTEGRGWNYDWKKSEAERNVLRTHTTAVSARKLHQIDINDLELPRKYFVVGRNFRNETVDRTHLAGFYQTDGIVIGEDVDFRHLKGYINRFFRKMGFNQIRMIPTYYPYTEMSMEIQIKDEVSGEWLGLGGSGIFRPEVVKPMLDRDARVLAWGLGLPRIAMKSSGQEDLRELYRNDLELIEKTNIWRPENFVSEDG